MLTRLHVKGFKNLLDVDVSFGPFTCIAGINGVGKSNLFDAIQFLSALADKSLIDAARSIRDDGGHTTDIRSLFFHYGQEYSPRISFAAEMIVPRLGIDDLGQEAKATTTFLRYELELAFRPPLDSSSMQGGLEIVKEELRHITAGETPRKIPFPHSTAWRKSAIAGRRSGIGYISTEVRDGKAIIRLHQDRSKRTEDRHRGGGRPAERLAATLPRSIISATNAAESPTALLARREMQSWRILHLEPTALRKPDELINPSALASDGAHLPATLYRLAKSNAIAPNDEHPSLVQESSAYSRLASRLSQLVEGIRAIWIERDLKRELLTLVVKDRDGTSHPARALSDGTLRFMALAVLEMDPTYQALVCLEEPENGIHPERIPAMIRLMSDIAVDPIHPVGPDNPLRQVIVNSHSPVVVGIIEPGALLMTDVEDKLIGQSMARVARYSCIDGSWRSRKLKMRTMSRGKLLSYLNPFEPPPEGGRNRIPKRIVDRPDIQPLLFKISD